MNTPAPDSTPSTLDLGVGGMTCASCVARVEKASKKAQEGAMPARCSRNRHNVA